MPEDDVDPLISQARECRKLAEGMEDSWVKRYLLETAEVLEEEAGKPTSS